MHETNIWELIQESNLINFAILAIVIVYIAFRELPRAVEGKKAELSKEMEEAAQMKAEAEEKLRAVEKEIERAQTESLKIVSEAKESAETLQTKVLEDAKTEIQRLHDNAEKEISLEKSLAIETIKGQISKLAVEKIESVLMNKREDIDALISKKIKSDLEAIK